MSRIGKKPIIIEGDISVTINDRVVNVSGPRGALVVQVPNGIEVKLIDKTLHVKTKKEGAENLQGLTRTLISNAIYGVKSGWTKSLELVGVGFRAQTSGNELILSLGFSHPVKIIAPSGVTFAVSENKITVSGADKYLIGEVAASIRRLKGAEPYKGKGIRYEGEYIRKKVGKAAKVVGGVAGAKS